MKKHLLKPLCAIALIASPAPLLAQDEEPSSAEMEEMMAGLGAMFAAEPLTAEQEARIPAARAVVTKLMPEGTMQEMMGPMFDNIVGPLMTMAQPDARDSLSDIFGVPASNFQLDDAAAGEAAAMLDPAWETRFERQMAVMPEIVAQMVAGVEPSMREAMTELYAVNFDAGELREIDAFFSTETGANFARKSFTMASDPRIMAASMEALPQMMAGLADIESKMREASADLPAVRAYADLSEAERLRLAELTNYSQAELAELMAGAANQE